MSGNVQAVSAAGFAFEAEGDRASFPTGVGLEQIVIRIGTCVLDGEAVVRNARSTEGQRVEVGCLFYPAARHEERWATLLAGIEVAGAFQGDGD